LFIVLSHVVANLFLMQHDNLYEYFAQFSNSAGEISKFRRTRLFTCHYNSV